ncbi:MAG: glycosyltransferase [Sedimentisphaerales bacterium]|nr:glycosyltransferase [Sedimentisphaerales bacterium]
MEQVCPEVARAGSVFGKLRHYHEFRRKAWRFIENEDRDALLWVAKIDTAMALGKRLLRRRYILTLQELHDKYYFYQKAIRFYASHASAVVVPEYCRANILRCWHGLNTTPFVLPNRPVVQSRDRFLPVSDTNTAQIMDSIPKGRRILLYQGILAPDRDLAPVARAARELGEDYQLVIMGRDHDGHLGRLREIYPDLMCIPWVRPPVHLEVTSHAHIGIAFYKYDALNSIFCAPNKIWEYSAFGVPMICQDIPGLRYTVGAAEAGLCVDSGSTQSVVDGIKQIEEDYEYYRQRASEFYDSVNTIDQVSRIVDSVLANGSRREEVASDSR